MADKEIETPEKYKLSDNSAAEKIAASLESRFGDSAPETDELPESDVPAVDVDPEVELALNENAGDDEPDSTIDDDQEPEDDVEEETDVDPVPESVFSEAEVMLAASVGIDDDDLASFADSKSLMATIRLLKKRGVAGEAVKTPAEEVAEEEDPQTDAAIELIDISKFEEEFDDTTVGHVKATRAMQELLNKQQEQIKQLLARDQARTESVTAEQHNTQLVAFHQVMDSIGDGFYGKLYTTAGTLASLRPEDDARRAAVYEQAEILKEVAAKRVAAGKSKPVPFSALIQQAHKIVHGEEIAKRARAKKVNAVKDQSKMRRQVGGSGASSRRPEKSDYSAETIAKSPKLQAIFNGR